MLHPHTVKTSKKRSGKKFRLVFWSDPSPDLNSPKNIRFHVKHNLFEAINMEWNKKKRSCP